MEHFLAFGGGGMGLQKPDQHRSGTLLQCVVVVGHHKCCRSLKLCWSKLGKEPKNLSCLHLDRKRLQRDETSSEPTRAVAQGDAQANQRLTALQHRHP